MTAPAPAGASRRRALWSSWPLLVWLTAVWTGLWGSLTFANVLGGLAVALVVVAVLPPDRTPDRAVVSPAGLARFVGRFAVDLVRSSLQVSLLTLRPRLHLRSAVLAVPVRGASDALLTLLADAISLTPGTLTLEVDRSRSTLYVHVLDVGAEPDAVERVRRDIVGLERLAIRAVGSAECRRLLDEDERRSPR